jgi:hypothetical protein
MLVLHSVAALQSGHDVVETLYVKVTVVIVMVHLDNRGQVADAETALNDLDGKLAVAGRDAAPVGLVDPVLVFQIPDQPGGAPDVAGRAVAKQHDVLSRLLGSEIRVESQESKYAVDARTQVVRDLLRRLLGKVAINMLGLLASTQDQFMGVLEVLGLKLFFEDLPERLQINFSARLRRVRQFFALSVS